MQLDPYIQLWMHDQEIQRTMKQNALEREARLGQAKREGFPINALKVSRIRTGLTSLQRVLRPSRTGSA
jgi:hypothetical protein